MRLHLTETEFKSAGFGEEKHAKIAAKNNAKIFFMLTSGFYSRPKESMFREICANALDEARHASRPFRVMLPSHLKPELVIRDWGRGMSHDFVMSRAMSLGDSTKDDDNDAIGGFGLGMKTPFCVTEQFSLVVYRGDHRQTYVIDRKGGTPRVMTDASVIEALEGDDQCTGTEIRIPAPAEERGEYMEIARRILRLFPADSYSLEGLENEAPRYMREGSTWALLEGSNEPSYARMGCIAYRLDMQALLGDAWEEQGLHTGLELRFDIGALTVTPNREALLLDGRTRAAISAALEEARREFAADYVAAIQAAPSYLSAWRTHANLRKRSGNLAGMLPKRVQWSNGRVSAWIGGKLVAPAANISWTARDLSNFKAPRGEPNNILDYTTATSWRYAPDFPVWILCLDDLPHNAHRLYIERIHLVRHALPKLYSAGVAPQCAPHRFAIISQKYVDEMLLEEGEFFRLSNFTPEKPPKKPREKGVYISGKIAGYRSDKYSGRTSSHWARCEVNIDAGGLFVPFDTNRPCDHLALEYAKLPLWHGRVIFGLPQHLRQSLDPAKWTNVIEASKATLDGLMRSRRVRRAYMRQRFRDHVALYRKPSETGHNSLNQTNALHLLRVWKTDAADVRALRMALRTMGMQDERERKRYKSAIRILRESENRGLIDAGSLDKAILFDFQKAFDAILEKRPLARVIWDQHKRFAARGETSYFFRALEMEK